MSIATSMVIAVAAVAAGPNASIAGNWTNPSGSVTVEIGPCKSGMCGTVIRASDKAKADAAKGGTEHLVGTVLLSNLSSDSKGLWRGANFVPDMNVRSKAKLKRNGSNRLKVSGCGPGGMVCKAQEWTRAAD
jgi:uncharacterized protein (DUF2147 family)